MTISLEKVTVQVQSKVLVHNIDMQIKAGEVLGVLGKNGAGKSTLLRAIAGVQKFTGSCQLEGRSITNFSSQQLARQRAVLAQETQLSFPLKAIEVVRLASSFASLSRAQENKLLCQCLGQFAVEHLADRDYRTLSGGEKQRVQLARVLAQLYCHRNGQAQYLLLDEPVASLDLHQQLATLAMFRQLAAQDIGLFMIIHDMNLAALYCDKILVLKGGQAIAYGHPNDTLTENLMRNAFQVNLQVQPHPDIARPTLIPRLEQEEHNHVCSKNRNN